MDTYRIRLRIQRQTFFLFSPADTRHESHLVQGFLPHNKSDNGLRPTSLKNEALLMVYGLYEQQLVLLHEAPINALFLPPCLQQCNNAKRKLFRRFRYLVKGIEFGE